jgi:hypothetical protein
MGRSGKKTEEEKIVDVTDHPMRRSGIHDPFDGAGMPPTLLTAPTRRRRPAVGAAGIYYDPHDRRRGDLPCQANS